MIQKLGVSLAQRTTIGIVVLSLVGCNDNDNKRRASLVRMYGHAQVERIEKLKQCRERAEAQIEANSRQTQRGQKIVIGNLSRNHIDPAGDAREAAEKGQWGLIRSYAMIGNGPFGVECRTENGLRHGQPLTQAYRVYSDVAGSCETFASGGDCSIDAKLDRYAPAYNLALVLHPEYPYPDLCRPLPTPRQAPVPSDEGRWSDPAVHGFRPVTEPSRSRTIHEAARRGDVAALERFLRRDDGALEELDPYVMTPLAWAVTYRQANAARWLVRHGASPLGDDCGTISAETSPLRLALRTGQDELAAWLNARIPQDRREDGGWSQAMIDAAAVGGSPRFLQRMLAEPHREVPREDRSDANRRTPYPLATKAIIDRYRAGLCWRAPIARGTKVELVSIYEPRQDKKRPQGGATEGEVKIVLRAADRPILLILSAHDATHWVIEAEPGATLAGIIVLGLLWQEVSGVPDSVPVVINSNQNFCTEVGWRGAGARQGEGDAEDFASLVATIHEMTGRKVDRFHGKYDGKAFVID